MQSSIINYNPIKDGTSDFGTLVIRNTNTDGAIWYEGSWTDNSSNIVGIQYIKEGKEVFWLAEIKIR